MSVVAALHADNTTWIASDRQVTGNGLRLNGQAKWVLGPKWAVGVAGTLRALCAIDADPRILQDLTTPWQFTERLQDLFDRIRYQPTQTGGPAQYEDEFILAHPSGVWSICNTLSVHPIPPGTLIAIGSGERVALGAGHATKGLLPPNDRLEAAVQAAIDLQEGCGGETFLKSLKP